MGGVKMNLDQSSIAQYVLDNTKKKGIKEAEAFLLDSTDLTVEVAEKKVENLKSAQVRGLGIRVIIDHKQGFASTSDLSQAAILKVIDNAIQNADQVERDENWILSSPHHKYPSLDIYDEGIFKASLQEKIEKTQEMEEAAKSYDARVTLTEKAVYNESCYNVGLYNSLGLSAQYRGSYCGGYVVVVGQEGNDNQTGFGLQYVLKYKDLNPSIIGLEAGEKAVRMLGAKTIKSASVPVLLDPHTMTSFLGILQTALSAEAVIKGNSFLAGKEGELIASSCLNIIDDGAMEGRLGSSPFDGEGTPTSRTVLIENGSLRGFLHNLYTAKKTNSNSTGNGMRGSFKTVPDVGISNMYIEKGEKTPKDLMTDIDYGLYVTNVMGVHTANPISGNFSLGASGLLIEKGKLTRPFKGVAIAGNIKDLLTDVEGVGDDLTFFVSKGAPTVRIKTMSVSGS